MYLLLLLLLCSFLLSSFLQAYLTQPDALLNRARPDLSPERVHFRSVCGILDRFGDHFGPFGDRTGHFQALFFRGCLESDILCYSRHPFGPQGSPKRGPETPKSPKCLQKWSQWAPKVVPKPWLFEILENVNFDRGLKQNQGFWGSRGTRGHQKSQKNV